MESIRIRGNNDLRLRGEVRISGSKNAVLPAIAAGLLTRREHPSDEHPAGQGRPHHPHPDETAGRRMQGRGEHPRHSDRRDHLGRSRLRAGPGDEGVHPRPRPAPGALREGRRRPARGLCHRLEAHRPPHQRAPEARRDHQPRARLHPGPGGQAHRRDDRVREEDGDRNREPGHGRRPGRGRDRPPQLRPRAGDRQPLRAPGEDGGADRRDRRGDDARPRRQGARRRQPRDHPRPDRGRNLPRGRGPDRGRHPPHRHPAGPPPDHRSEAEVFRGGLRAGPGECAPRRREPGDPAPGHHDLALSRDFPPTCRPSSWS